jgi:hypothetical protein
MDDPGTQLVRDARALLSAAQQFERDAGDRAAATLVAPALVCVERTLRALSDACEAATRSIIPTGDIRESSTARFARAAADWPGSLDGSAPSYEEQVRLLSSLHDAAAAIRIAERRTPQARKVVAAKVAVASASEMPAARATT